MGQNDKMKVLQINTVCGKGSTGRIVVDINNRLIEKGHHGMIIYGVGESEYRYSYKIGGKINYYYHNIMSRIFGHEGFYSVIATRKFLRWMDEYKPDIIHLHNLHGHYININLLFEYLKLHKIQVIWTLHDCWTFTGKCTHFDLVKCDKWKTECDKCPQLSEYPSSIFDSSKRDYAIKSNLFEGIDILFATPSDWLRKYLDQSYLRDNNAEVINNGIDLNVFKKRSLEDAELREKIQDKFVILGVASPWSGRKGFDDFIKIAKSLIDNDKIAVVMVGLNDEQLRKLPKNVIGLKRTNSAENLAQIYSRANVFVNATYEDNYPTVNLESIACGTSVIAYDTGGSSEAVKKYNAGYIVKQGEYARIVEIVNELISEKQRDLHADVAELSNRISDEKYVALYMKLLRNRK